MLLKTNAVFQQRLLGDDMLATTARRHVRPTATFVLCHFLAAAAFGGTTPQNIRRSAMVLVIIVILMTAALRQSRKIEIASSTNVRGYGAACSIISLPSALTMRTTLS